MTKTKRWLQFLAAAVVLQGLMLLFCTEAGLTALYPLLVRGREEAFQTRGAYTVYYDMRLPLTEADCIAVGVDFHVKESYDTFGHLFRFLKQYRNIKTLHIAHPAAEAMGHRLDANASGEVLMEDGALTPVLTDFADLLAAVNDTQPPLKKFAIAPWHGTAEEIGTAPAAENEVTLVLLDRDSLMDAYPTLRERGVLCVEMKYVKCPTVMDGKEALRNDIHLPFTGEETRIAFMPASRIQWFYDYYRQVTNLFGLPSMGAAAERLDNMAAEFVITIANGTLADA